MVVEVRWGPKREACSPHQVPRRSSPMTLPHPESLLKVSMAMIALYFKMQGEHFLYKGSKRPR